MNMPAPKPAPTVEDFLAEHKDDIRSTVNWLRALLKREVPDLIEAVYPGWKLIGYRIPSGKETVYIGFIAPQGDRVALGFEWGVRIPDPHQRLRGSGRRVRQLEFRAVGDTPDEIVAGYLHAAIIAATER